MQIKFTLKLKIPTRFPQHDLLSGCSHGWEKSPYEGKWPFGYDICKCKWRKKHHRTLNWKVLNWGGGEGIQGGIDEQHPGNMIHWAQMLLLYGKIFFFFLSLLSNQVILAAKRNQPYSYSSYYQWHRWFRTQNWPKNRSTWIGDGGGALQVWTQRTRTW